MQTYHLSKFGCYRVYSGGGKAICVIQVTYNPNHNILVLYNVFVPLRLLTSKTKPVTSISSVTNLSCPMTQDLRSKEIRKD